MLIFIKLKWPIIDLLSNNPHRHYILFSFRSAGTAEVHIWDTRGRISCSSETTGAVGLEYCQEFGGKGGSTAHLRQFLRPPDPISRRAAARVKEFGETDEPGEDLEEN